MTRLDGRAPTILTAVGARRLTARIRDAVSLADDLLVQAYTGLAWEALGHATWEAYCAAELPELRALKLRTPTRRERVAKLRAEGATIPEIVAATGSSLGTVHRDLVALEGGHKRPESPAEAGGEKLTVWQVVVREVTARGHRGLTCLEFEDAMRWRHGAASAAFNAAERKGHIRRDGRRRDGYGAYVAAEAGGDDTPAHHH